MQIAIPCKGGPLDGQKVHFRERILLIYAERGGNEVYRAVCVGPCKIPVRYRYEGNFLVRFPDRDVVAAVNKKEAE